MKNNKKILLILMCLASMSGCMMKLGDELLVAPKPSMDYIALQNKIDSEISSGKVMSAPDSGSNRNTVQLIDIDADAEEEAIAFFRESAVSGVFNTIIYKKEQDKYFELGRIEGHGSSIDSVEYPKLNVIGAGGIAISWKISNQLEKGLTVATVLNGEVEVVLDTQYMSYFIKDIDYDGLDEIFIINKENDKNILQMYKMVDDNLKMVSKIELSKEIDSVARVTYGEFISSGQSVAIDSRVIGDVGLITDVIALKDDELINITIDTDTLSGMKTYRSTTSYSTHIKRDNILYVPTTVPMNSGINGENTGYFVTNWHVFDPYNATQSDLFTYHNSSENWYVQVDTDMKDAITIERNTTSNIKRTKFSQVLNEETEEELFEVFVIPKDDFSESYFDQSYLRLGRTTSSVFLVKNISYKLTENDILTRFNIINYN